MKALIVDDDRTLADLLAFTLRRAGFQPHLAYDAPSAIKMFRQIPVDIAILDINMPGEPGLKDGFDLCRAIRQESDIPIILLTVRDEEEDIIRGLSIGADYYVLKPFSPRQLVARVETILRRASLTKALDTEPYKFQDVTFDPNLREFTQKGQAPIKLTRLEGRLLETLMLNAGQILPADSLIDHVWGPGGGSTEMLRQLVKRLRAKIEKDPGNPKLIQNLPGVGYGFTI